MNTTFDGWTAWLQTLQPPTKTGGFMSKTIFVGLLAAGLIAAPLPVLAQTATGTQTVAPDKKPAKAKRAPTPGQLAARVHEEMRHRMEASQGRQQDREGNEVVAILKCLQQAPQGGRLIARAVFSARHFQFYGGADRTTKKKRASARLEVSPTPSVVIGTGAPRNNRIALVTPSRAPARMTQSSKRLSPKIEKKH
jgi:hypothetical protein